MNFDVEGDSRESERRMDTNKQSHSWWFDSHNSPKCSPWLESTLAELNEKTKTMLKLVEDDADSFAQRAEMYYKKRPELISMVEDFYRTHRSLAERYDQLRGDRGVRVRSPLRKTLSLPKDEYENVFDSINSVKSFDSFSEVACSSEDGAESEVDDPEVVEREKEKPYSGWASFDEYTQLKDQLDLLREENEILKNQIEQKDQEKEELWLELSENVGVLKKMREELEASKEENSFMVVKRTIDDVPTEEVNAVRNMKPNGEQEFEYMTEETEGAMLKNVVETLKLQKTNLEETVEQIEEENIKLGKKFEEAMYELLEVQAANRQLQGALTVKEEQLEREKEEMTKLTMQFEYVRSDLVMLTRVSQEHNSYVENALTLREERIKQAEEEIVKLKRRYKTAVEDSRYLFGEMQRKEKELVDALAAKDDEKRAVIRELSLAMEILREDNQFLKQSIKKEIPKKSSPGQLFKFSKLFSSRSPVAAAAAAASVVPR